MSSKEKKSVLIIDDEQQMSKEIRFRFGKNEDYDFEVYEKGSAQESIELLKNNKFDVVVIDMRMEGLTSGIEVLKALYADNDNSIKIVFTGFPDYKDCVECMRNGAWDYIIKGKDENSIKKVVETAVARLKTVEYFNQKNEYMAREWIPRHRAELDNKYSGQYVAILDDQIICAAPDRLTLQQQLKGKDEQKLIVFRVGIRKKERENE